MNNGTGIIVNASGLLALESAVSEALYYADDRSVIRTPDGEYHRFIWDGLGIGIGRDSCWDGRNAYIAENVIKIIKDKKSCVVVREGGRTTSAVYRTSDDEGEDGEFENLFDELVARMEQLETILLWHDKARQHKLWVSGIGAEIEHPMGYTFVISCTGETVSSLYSIENGQRAARLASVNGYQHDGEFYEAMSPYLASDEELICAINNTTGENPYHLTLAVEPHFRVRVRKPEGGIYEVEDALDAEYLNEAIDECKSLMDEIIYDMTGEYTVKYDKDHRHSLWFGGRVAERKYKGYTFILGAYGDVYAHLCNRNGDELADVKDKSNAGCFMDEMRMFISGDDELMRFIRNADEETPNDMHLKLDNNNWFEVLIDGPDGKQLDCGWVCESDYIDEAIKEMVDAMDDAIADIEKCDTKRKEE